MSNLKDTIETIGRDIGGIKEKQSTSLTTDKAYALFPTYNNFIAHVVEARAWMSDPFVLKSQLPTSEIEELKKEIKELKQTISEIKESIQK